MDVMVFRVALRVIMIASMLATWRLKMAHSHEVLHADSLRRTAKSVGRSTVDYFTASSFTQWRSTWARWCGESGTGMGDCLNSKTWAAVDSARSCPKAPQGITNPVKERVLSGEITWEQGDAEIRARRIL